MKRLIVRIALGGIALGGQAQPTAILAGRLVDPIEGAADADRIILV